jgi:hypothetical protein
MPAVRFVLAAGVCAALACAAPPARKADVVIYGATPAGLTAAVAASREGVSVVVVEPAGHIGGMVTGGIAITDTATPEYVGGLARRFFEEAAALQGRPAKEEPPLMQFRGRSIPFRMPRRWDLEPKLMRQVFEGWVREHRIPILTAQTVASVSKVNGAIRSIRLGDGSVIQGRVFIDASYEGDLMAKAQVGHTWGRESAKKYGESLAGVREPHFRQSYGEEVYGTPGIEYMHHGQFGADIRARDGQGRLLWGVAPRPSGRVGDADRLMQAYCFRLIATQRKDILVPWPKPDKYEPDRYELLLKYIEAHPGISFARLVHLGPIPNGKWDLNASGPFSIDYIGGNRGFAEASPAERRRIYQDHLNYQKGFFWFLAHDPRVPGPLRDDVNGWGLCRDEYADSGNWPQQLYIRECRRMVGEYVMTERDVLRDKVKHDSVGMGSFVLDSHWVQRFETKEGFVRVEGHLDESINLSRAPYEIPYRSLTPKAEQCRNLLVPVCLSASHVALCTIRMEPVYMMLGEAAGVAAAMAATTNKAVQRIDVGELLRTLEEHGGILNRKSAEVK